MTVENIKTCSRSNHYTLVNDCVEDLSDVVTSRIFFAGNVVGEEILGFLWKKM